MANEHQGRVAVVTGGSGGIGSAIAARLGQGGAIVHVLDVKPPASADGQFHSVDVANEAQVNDAFNAIGGASGRIDYLVCCAGVYRARPFLELSLEDWQQTLQINLTGYFLCCRAVLHYMRPQRFGRIVLFSSVDARTGKNVAHYTASKGGILGLMRSLALESAGENIRVNAISPGMTDTPTLRAVVPNENMESQRKRIPLDRIGQVQDMADACMFLLSEDSSYVMGQDLRVTGGSALW